MSTRDSQPPCVHELFVGPASPGEGAKLRTRKQELVAKQEERMAAKREGQRTTRVMVHI